MGDELSKFNSGNGVYGGSFDMKKRVHADPLVLVMKMSLFWSESDSLGK
jgi:hypothetical protein